MFLLQTQSAFSSTYISRQWRHIKALVVTRELPDLVLVSSAHEYLVQQQTLNTFPRSKQSFAIYVTTAKSLYALLLFVSCTVSWYKGPWALISAIFNFFWKRNGLGFYGKKNVIFKVVVPFHELNLNVISSSNFFLKCFTCFASGVRLHVYITS